MLSADQTFGEIPADGLREAEISNAESSPWQPSRELSSSHLRSAKYEPANPRNRHGPRAIPECNIMLKPLSRIWK